MTERVSDEVLRRWVRTASPHEADLIEELLELRAKVRHAEAQHLSTIEAIREATQSMRQASRREGRSLPEEVLWLEDELPADD